MNAQRILAQLMQQAGAGRRGGLDVQGLMDGLSSRTAGKGASRSGGGLGSALGGGALGLLVGSKRGRKLGGKALKYGAIAGIGVLAWKACQGSRTASPGERPHEGQPLEELGDDARERRSLALLQAMIMAARADGHIDEHERALIGEQIDALGADDELHAWIERQLAAPLDALALARQADSPQAAREIYLTSVAVIDEQNPMERAWLDQLASGLGLDEAMKDSLEREALAAGEAEA